MYLKIFLLILFVYASEAFSCPRANGIFVNPDNYRSYYTCSNWCSRLEYCSWPMIYYARINQICTEGTQDWTPRFDLTGEFKFSQNADVVVHQEGYHLSIVQDTLTTRYEFHAQYINQTHAIGKQTVHRLSNNCISVFNARIIAIRNKGYCYYETLHPYSTRCDLPINYSGNHCKNY